MNIEVIKSLANKTKNKAFVLGSAVAIGLMSAVPAFAETSVELSSEANANLVDVSSAMNTAISSTVGVMLSMMIGLIPVALQVLSAFVLFKFGKKFFAKLS